MKSVDRLGMDSAAEVGAARQVSVNERTPRILFLMPFWSASSEVWLQRMIGELSSWISVVGTYVERPSDTHWKGIIPVKFIGSSNTWWYRVARRLAPNLTRSAWQDAEAELLRIIQGYEIDTILVHFGTTAVRFKAVWEKTSANLFVWCHGYDVTWNLRSPENPGRTLHDATYLASFKALVDKALFIANSKCTAGKLYELGIGHENVHVNYLGVPIEEGWERRSSPHHLRVLYLGRLVDFKGPDCVIQAFEIARDQGFSGELVIAGDGPLRVTCELLRARSRYRKDIMITGAVTLEEGDKLRRSADIFTAHNRKGELTRQEEALGISILEAMSVGLPVVTGRSGGVTETIVDGETGFLVEPGDVKAHAQALLRLGEDPELRTSMGRAARERVHLHFSLQSQVEALKAFLVAAPGKTRCG